MRTILRAMLTAGLLTLPAVALAEVGSYVVQGVEEDDMLKMRAGPGVGYNVILGLPNGTMVHVYSCEQTGSTRWCKVALKQSRAVKGYVSWAYLQEK